MKSWSNWKDLTDENILRIPASAKGVYVLRKTKNIRAKASDIIYIGQSGTGKQGIRKRLKNLLSEMNSSRDKWKNHSASQKIKKHIKSGLQFSWVQCSKYSDGVEKAFLLAFISSAKKLPDCNDRF